MNFKTKSIKMPGKRQRADAYRGLTYLQLNTDKGTQQILQGEGRGRIGLLTRKSSVKRKRPEMRACVSLLRGRDVGRGPPAGWSRKSARPIARNSDRRPR